MTIRTDVALTGEEISTPEPCSNVDLREQLFNTGSTGKITDVQVAAERVMQLNGILFDIDPKLIKAGGLFLTVPQDPREFYTAIIGPMLDRHEVLKRAEVRNSGTGLHVILRFVSPVVFDTDAERDRWIGIIQVVQSSLPIDPDQPHITAVTRPIGSINSKSNATVSMLTPGTPVPEGDVLCLFDEMAASPFKTVAKIILGAEKIEPCPVCGQEGSRLSALNHVGQCYGSCGKVKLERIYDSVFAPRPQKDREGAHDTSDE